MSSTEQYVDPNFYASRADSLRAGHYGLRIFDPKKQPSWKRFGDGTAGVEVTTHARNRYLGVHVEEHAKEGGSKVASATLNPVMAQQVFDLMVRAGFTASEGVCADPRDADGKLVEA